MKESLMTNFRLSVQRGSKQTLVDTKHHTVHSENDSMRFCNCCSLVYRVLDFMIDFGLVMICMASRLDTQCCEALCSTTEPHSKAKIVRLALTTEAQLFWGPLSDLLL